MLVPSLKVSSGYLKRGNIDSTLKDIGSYTPTQSHGPQNSCTKISMVPASCTGLHGRLLCMPSRFLSLTLSTAACSTVHHPQTGIESTTLKRTPRSKRLRHGKKMQNVRPTSNGTSRSAAMGHSTKTVAHLHIDMINAQ